MTTIDLSELTGGGEIRNLTGHERGVLAREHYKLEQLDAEAEPVIVLVPSSVYTLTPSFFQGMFAESVQKFRSRENFLEHYRFEASTLIMRQVERGIIGSQMRRGELLSA
jgi:hypothetical protein